MKLTVERTVPAREIEPGESIIDVDGVEVVVDEVSHKADGFKLYVKRPKKAGEKVNDGGKESPRKTLEFKPSSAVAVRPSRQEGAAVIVEIGRLIDSGGFKVEVGPTSITFPVTIDKDRVWNVTIEA